LEIYINQGNKTLDPTISIPKKSSLNITLKYMDLMTRSFISDATVNITGAIFSANLTENDALKQYAIILNTSTLNIGLNNLTISASKNNYTLIQEHLIVNIRKISAEIITISGDSTFSVKLGKDIAFNIQLNNLDFGGIIKNATVVYIWVFGVGQLWDLDNDGIYTVSIKTVRKGYYTMQIQAYIDEEHGFNTYNITLFVMSASKNVGLVIWAVIVSAGFIGVSIFGVYMIRMKEKKRNEEKDNFIC
jgi:hypothetical protein